MPEVKIFRLLFIIVITIIIVKLSTIGWRPSHVSFSISNENTPLAEVLKSHVYKLSHEIGDRSIFKYEKLKQAEDYITEEFISSGYNPEFQHYELYGLEVKNIIAEKKGYKNRDEIIIVGAHYDTCFNPGADDNASAVAGLLEMARFISNLETKRSIRFIAFVNEEPPFFLTEDMGSRVYARQVKAKGENIKAVLILESIGYYSNKLNSQRYPPLLGLFYPNRGNFILIVGNFSSRWLVKEVVSNFKKKTKFPIESFVGPSIVPGVNFSDHWSFWKEGLPAVMITDTAFYRYVHYHRASDTYEKLDYESMSEVVRGLRLVLTELANR